VVSGEIVCSFAALDVIGEALRIDARRFPFAIQHYSGDARGSGQAG
jgi:hypothetical protein